MRLNKKPRYPNMIKDPQRDKCEKRANQKLALGLMCVSGGFFALISYQVYFF